MNIFPPRGTAEDVARALKILPADVTLTAMATLMTEQNPGLFRQSGTVADAAKLLMEHHKNPPSRHPGRPLKKKTFRFYVYANSAVCDAFGCLPLSSVTTKAVEEWLASLSKQTGKPVGRLRQASLLRYLKWVLRTGGLANPLRGVKRSTRPEGQPKYFSFAQLVKIMTVTPNHQRGFIAVLLFTGMRPETAQQLDATAFNWENRTITITEVQDKQSQRRVLRTCQLGPGGHTIIGEILPVMWRWLKKYPFESCHWDNVRRYLRLRIGYWHRGGLRKTAATYTHRLRGGSAASRLLTQDDRRVLRRYANRDGSIDDAFQYTQFSPQQVPAYRRPKSNARNLRWPPRELIARTLQTQTLGEFAHEFGVGVSVAYRHCKRSGIPIVPARKIMQARIEAAKQKEKKRDGRSFWDRADDDTI